MNLHPVSRRCLLPSGKVTINKGGCPFRCREVALVSGADRVPDRFKECDRPQMKQCRLHVTVGGMLMRLTPALPVLFGGPGPWTCWFARDLRLVRRQPHFLLAIRGETAQIQHAAPSALT